MNAEEKLKLAAKLYADKEGSSLLAEVSEIERQNVSYMTPRADKTVRDLVEKGRRPKRRSAVIGVAAAAACVLIMVRLISGVPDISGDTPSLAPEPPGDTPSLPYMPDEIIPISFTLPADYRVKTADLDNGMSVYKLESGEHGDVVLTMYYETDAADKEQDFYQGFDEVIIDGTPVHAKVKDTYKLLAFEAEDVRYTLSSADNLGALAAFYRQIAESVYA